MVAPLLSLWSQLLQLIHSTLLTIFVLCTLTLTASKCTMCLLITLNKCWGIRPMRGNSEDYGKPIIKTEVMEATGPIWLCAGQPAGWEASVYALRSLFANPASEGIFLVDARNTFSHLSPQSALQNVQVICPSLAPILINCYRNPTALFTPNVETIWSKEG